MKIISELEAKQIVRDGLDTWVGTYREFQKFVEDMAFAAKGIVSPEKREAFVDNYLRKFKPSLYAKKVHFGLSNNFAIEVQRQILSADSEKISKAQKQKAAGNHQKLAQIAYQLSKKSTYVFVVKDDTRSNVNELILLIFSTRGKDKHELFQAHAVAVVKKHCLQRLVQRLNLQTIHQAIEEILPATKWLEGSGNELAGRPAGSYGKGGIKRHVPTPNGALLLLTAGKNGTGYKPEQECSLITWIHNRQFKKNQEVTTRDFKYAMTVNCYLSDPMLSEYISILRREIANADTESGTTTVIVHLHGERYPAQDLLDVLERGAFLDFTIDFERDILNR